MKWTILLALIYLCLSQTNVNRSTTSLSTNIFKSLSPQANGNFLISPVSIHLALSLAANGAAGDTQTQMLQVISPENSSLTYVNNLSNNMITKNSVISFIRNAIDNTKVNIANGIFTAVTPLKTFSSLAKDKYHATAEKLTDATQVNNWVAEKTNKKITHIIDAVTPDIKLIIISAVYFQSRWKNEFKEDVKRDFKMKNNTVAKKDFIVNTIYSAKYYDVGGVKAITIELRDNYVFDVIVPGSLDDYIGSLDKDTLGNIFNKMEQKNIQIHMPIFTFDFSADLITVLEKLGMKKAFTSEADFSGISTEEKLFINSVKHKTFIKVTKYGVEAAAATSLALVGSAMSSEQPELIEMIVDKPFLFTIREKTKDSLMFLGKVENPE
jgi:serine protease inhibitor